MHQTQGGNVEGVVGEARQTHRAIMTATVGGIKQQDENEFRRQQPAMNDHFAVARSQVGHMRRQHAEHEMQAQALQAQVPTWQAQNDAMHRHVSNSFDSVTGV